MMAGFGSFPRRMTYLLACLVFAMLVGSDARAGVSVFTASGSDKDGPLEAKAEFVTSGESVQITLTNLLGADSIKSIGQGLSGITFTLSDSLGTADTKTIDSAQLGNVDGSGKVTYISGSANRWFGNNGGNFSVVGDTIKMTVIGGSQPTQLIIPYMVDGSTHNNAKGGFNPHNPSVIGPAVFTLNFAGITASTKVTSVTFAFGTGPDTTITVAAVPEPSTLAMGAVGVALCLGVVSRQRGKDPGNGS